MSTKEQDRTIRGLLIIISAALFCTAIGGMVGWPYGCLLAGALVLLIAFASYILAEREAN